VMCTSHLSKRPHTRSDRLHSIFIARNADQFVCVKLA